MTGLPTTNIGGIDDMLQSILFKVMQAQHFLKIGSPSDALEILTEIIDTSEIDK